MDELCCAFAKELLPQDIVRDILLQNISEGVFLSLRSIPASTLRCQCGHFHLQVLASSPQPPSYTEPLLYASAPLVVAQCVSPSVYLWQGLGFSKMAPQYSCYVAALRPTPRQASGMTFKTCAGSLCGICPHMADPQPLLCKHGRILVGNPSSLPYTCPNSSSHKQILP